MAYKKDKNNKWQIDMLNCELLYQCASEEEAQELCDKLNEKQKPLNNDKHKIVYEWDLG